jgi:hypothetical protein
MYNAPAGIRTQRKKFEIREYDLLKIKEPY